MIKLKENAGKGYPTKKFRDLKGGQLYVHNVSNCGNLALTYMKLDCMLDGYTSVELSCGQPVITGNDADCIPVTLTGEIEVGE